MTGGTTVRSGRRAAGAGAALACAWVCAALALAAPAAGQAREDLGDELALDVQDLTGTLAPDRDLTVAARVSNSAGRDAEALRVVGTLHSAVSSRFAFQRAVDDGQLAAVVEGFSMEIDELGGGRSTVVELTRSAAELGFRRADQFGVYPLRLQLLQDGAVVDEVRTAVVFAPERVEEPVRTAFVLPVTADPLLRPDGSYDRGRLIAELGRGGRVQGLVGSLAARAGLPATVAADARLLNEVADIAGGVRVTADEGEVTELGPEEFLPDQARRLRGRATQVVGRHDVDLLAVPYGRADLTALVRGGMAAEALRHARDGATELRRSLDADPLSGTLWPPDALNPATMTVLSQADVDTVLLSEQHLAIPDGRALSPSPVRRLRSTASPTVLVPDPWLEEALAREEAPDGPAIAAQRILAETAAVYFERPFASDVRGLLLVPPQGWDPARGLAGRLMDGLADAPWLEPVTVSQLTRVVEPESEAVRLSFPAAARARELPPGYVAELRAARRALGSLAGVLVPGDNTPTRFDQRLLTAASVAYRPPDSAVGRAMIAAVADSVAELYSSVELIPGPQIWMDAEGPVPVTVANNADVPLQVRVRLLTQRFTFERPEGEVVLLEANETRTLTFQAQAVTAGGRAPISVALEDPQGTITLSEGTVVVRSTAVPIAAVIVTAAAGLFLLGWFVQQWSRRRRHAAPREHPATRRPAREKARR